MRMNKWQRFVNLLEAAALRMRRGMQLRAMMWSARSKNYGKGTSHAQLTTCFGADTEN